MIDCLADDSWDVRAAAVRALAPLAPAHSEVRDLLFDRLAGEHHSVVNSTTVAAMAPLVTSDQSIRSALLNHFAYHYDHEVRAAAVKALGVGFHKLDPQDLEVEALSPQHKGLLFNVQAPDVTVSAWARPLKNGWLALALA